MRTLLQLSPTPPPMQMACALFFQIRAPEPAASSAPLDGICIVIVLLRLALAARAKTCSNLANISVPW
jgi:hypothetical protein